MSTDETTIEQQTKRTWSRRPKVMRDDEPTSAERPQVYARHEAAAAMPRYGQGHMLDVPKAPKGLDLLWVRFQVQGRDDHPNVSAKMALGWEPVSAEEAANYGWSNPAQFDFIFGHSSNAGKNDPWVRYADVILMKRPTAIGDQERREKMRKAQDQVRALDENIFNEYAKSGARGVQREVIATRETINPNSYE